MIILNAILLAVAPASAVIPQSSNTQLETEVSAENEDPQNSAGYSPKDVLVAYRDAIQKLDASKMKALFSEESQIFENGKAEGTFLHYLEHHLGPELGHVKSFTFTQPTVSISQVDNTAFATETYDYVIVLHDDRKIERTGIATSVLVREGDNWKILRYHSSSRAPKKTE
ncbi:YybH family protein [Parasphingorhabdus sp.]|jgi:ketosteroid isomerase-like protein|uniref:YybH family protein n=1 Tax=Parasphingorhabdus sp. TaxID=2709688 RepID=UPI002F934500|tara:strand:- start:8323 stop:8832 length:510 start_codon:yes stop_codon:yes gene_type:complete